MFQVITVIIAFIVLTPIVAINSAYPLSIVWNWFVPLLGGPTITIPIAIGLSVLIGFFRVHDYYKDHETDTTKGVIHAIIGPWFGLLIAWIVFQFVEVPVKDIQGENVGVPAHVAVEPAHIAAESSAKYRKYLADKELHEAKYLQFLLDEEGKKKVK